jgi:hypothetical protein
MGREEYTSCVRFEVKNAIFWDVALCSSCVNRRFGGSTQRHIPEDGTLQYTSCFRRNERRDVSGVDSRCWKLQEVKEE